jgi:pimeloyl-ACP methyl ester carboxylesterase
VERFTVQSSDGAGISVTKTGAGPALLLIHGALLNATLAWAAVLPRLQEHFTVYAMDRRGRSPSGDGAEYSISLEAEDISRVVESISLESKPQPVVIVAHSYGALATIEALLTQGLSSVTRVILYEPPGIVAGIAARAAGVASMEQALAANDRDEVVRCFLIDQIGAPPEVLAALKSSPAYPIVLQIASTLPRESRTVNFWHEIPGRPGVWKTPTVLLLGSETKGAMRDGVMLLSRTIPDCRLVVIEGQGHSAMLQAPDLFVDTLLEAIGDLT